MRCISPKYWLEPAAAVIKICDYVREAGISDASGYVCNSHLPPGVQPGEGLPHFQVSELGGRFLVSAAVIRDLEYTCGTQAQALEIREKEIAQ
jgi:hypothetical protein